MKKIVKKAVKRKKQQPKIVRYYFEDAPQSYSHGGNVKNEYNQLVGRSGDEYYFLNYIFHHSDGFKGATGDVIMPVSKSYYDYAMSREGIIERYIDSMGEDEWIDVIGIDREEYEDEDKLIEAIEDGIYDLFLAGQLHPFEEVNYDAESEMRKLPQFQDSDEFPIFEVVGGGRIFSDNIAFDDIYNQELYDKIKEVEEFKEGGELNKMVKIYYNSQIPFYKKDKNKYEIFENTPFVVVPKSQVNEVIHDHYVMGYWKNYLVPELMRTEDKIIHHRKGGEDYAKGGGVKGKDENYNYIVGQIERNEKALEKTYGTERVEQLQQEIQRLKDKLKNEYGVKYANGGGVEGKLRKRFETYSDLDLQIYNGDNEGTLKNWNRKDAIDEAVETAMQENEEMAKGGEVKSKLRKRFETYSDLDLQIYNGDNEGTLKNWNRKDAIDEAVETAMQENEEMAKGGEVGEDSKYITTLAYLNGIHKSENTLQEFTKKVTEIIKRNGYRLPRKEAFKIAYQENKFADGGSADLDYNEIFNVLKSKIDDAIDNIPNEYESASQFKGEEIEHESRSGFIPYTDGGYEAVWFETLGAMYSSGYNLPTKPLDDEMNRQIDYNLELARESFSSDYPEIVEELGEENIDYNSLVDAGYSDEAEELSNAEMDMMWEDTILMRIFANYYNPENSRAKDGKHTIRLFGDVNLESPYHRTGNLDDSYEYEFTFDSIDELENEMAIGIAYVIAWFEGGMYNDSTAEMKVRRMEEGGEAGDYYEQLAVYVQGVGSIYNGTSMKKAIEKANSYLNKNKNAEIVIVDEKYGDEYDLDGNMKDEYAGGGKTKKFDGGEDYAKGGGVGNVKRFDVDFYDSSDANRETSIELIIKQDSLDNAIQDAIKKAYELKKNYVEFYHRGFFLGSINFANSKEFIQGKYYDSYISNNLYADGGEVEDWMEEALKYLIEETGNDNLEITYVHSKEFYCTGGDAEYRVFETEEDAEETAIEQVREDLQEMPESFNQEWLTNFFEADSFFRAILEEYNYGYATDIMTEDDGLYANRLIREMVDWGIMTEEQAMKSDAEQIASDNIQDFVNLLTDDQCTNGAFEYYANEFGEEEAYNLAMSNNLIDFQEASENAVMLDGIGHFLSSYDGETIYLTSNSVAYRTN